METKCNCCNNTIGDLPFVLDGSSRILCYYCECDLISNYSIENDQEFWNFVEREIYDQAA